MNIDELITFVRNNVKYKYSEDIIDKFIKMIRENREYNMIRFRPNGMDLIQTSNPGDYMKNNQIYIHPDTKVRYFIPEENFLVFRE